MGADIDVEPTAPLGDCGDLLAYRLRSGQLTPIDPKLPYGVLGHSYLAIKCDVRGLDQLLRARLDAIEAHVWSGEQAVIIDDVTWKRGGFAIPPPRRTPPQTRFLICCAALVAIWLLVGIYFALT